MKFALFFLSLVWTSEVFSQDAAIEKSIQEALQEKNYKKAETLFQEATAKGLKNANLLAMAGTIYSKLGDKEKAIQYLQNAVAFDPSQNTYKKNLVSLYLATRQSKKSLDLARALYESDSNSLDAIYLYAYSLFYNAKRKEALTLIEKAKGINANDYRFHLLESRLYLWLGSLEKSEVALQWAYALEKNNPEVLNNLALIEINLANQFGKQGDLVKRDEYRKNAKEHLEKANSVSEGNPIILRNLEIVNKFPI